MDFFLHYIYKLNYGLCYPFFSLNKALDIFFDSLMYLTLKLGFSADGKKKRIDAWKNYRGFSNVMDVYRTFILIDSIVVLFCGIESLYVLESGVAMFLVCILGFVIKYYLFDYEDKRMCQFSKLECASRFKKICWTLMAYSFIVFIWYICFLIKNHIHLEFVFLKDLDSFVLG